MHCPRFVNKLFSPRTFGGTLAFMETEAQEITLELQGGRVAGLAWGPEDGTPVLALHGWLDNASSFALLGPALRSCRVVAVDLPGHGLSDRRPPGCAYHFIDWIKDVYCVVKALGWEKFSIMGHSMGAAIGVLYAGAFPAQVRKLALLDGLGPFTVSPSHVPGRLADGVERLVVSFGKKSRVFSNRDDAARRLQASTTSLADRSAQLLLDRGIERTEQGFVWRADPRLRSPSLYRLSDDQVEAFLVRIEASVLVIRAKNGYPFERDWAARQVGSMRNVQVRTVSGGHHVHLDHPGRVLPFVVPFLAGDEVPDEASAG